MPILFILKYITENMQFTHRSFVIILWGSLAEQK